MFVQIAALGRAAARLHLVDSLLAATGQEVGRLLDGQRAAHLADWLSGCRSGCRSGYRFGCRLDGADLVRPGVRPLPGRGGPANGLPQGQDLGEPAQGGLQADRKRSDRHDQQKGPQAHHPEKGPLSLK